MQNQSHMKNLSEKEPEKNNRIESIELTPEEKSYVMKTAKIILPFKEDLIHLWAKLYFGHLERQRNIPLKKAIQSHHNQLLQSHFNCLFNDFIKYIGQGDIRKVLEKTQFKPNRGG